MENIQELEQKVKEIIKYKEETQNLDSNERKKVLESYKNLIGEFNYGRYPESNYYDIVENLVQIVKIEDGKMVISGDSKVFDQVPISYSGNEYGNNYTTFEIPEEDRVLVHSTNYFPNDKTIKTLYDGKKEYTIPIKINGEKKEVTYRHHRHTAHFVTNGVVRNTGDGNTWENMKYIVFEPSSFHKDQIVSRNFSDTFTNGSVKLSDEAILMVEKDAYDKLTDEQKKNYNIILYTGDFRQAVQNLLVLGNQKLSYTDANDPIHHNSINSAFEDNLNYRDRCLNCVINHVFDGSSRITITLDELVQIINILKENYLGHIRKCFTNNDKLIDDALLTFIYGSGIVDNKDGTFSIMSEEEVKNRYIHDNSLVGKVAVSDVDLQEAINIKNIYENVLRQDEYDKMIEQMEQDEYDKMMEELDEAYELNSLLSKKVSELSRPYPKILRHYLVYIGNQLQQNISKEIMVSCTPEKITISSYYPEYKQAFESHNLYNSLESSIDIMFDKNKSLLENINEGTKKMYEIVSELQKSKEGPSL